MNEQIQCTRCEPSQGDDDGLCCKLKRVVHRYKSYDKPSRPNRDYRRNSPSRYNKRNRQTNITNSETNMRDITNILDIYEYTLLLH